MKDFLLIFRTDLTKFPDMSPEEMQANMQRWMDWMGGIAAQDKLVDRGNRLRHDGKVRRADGIITDGPYAEIKESIGGYTVVRAESLEEAAQLSQGCPMLNFGGNVEIRELWVM